MIDFCWGPVAKATLHALGRADLDADDYDVTYVQIGTMAGADASLPGALLRSRNLTLSGCGRGGTPVAEIVGRLPEFLGQIAAGRVHVRDSAYPLSQVAEAWALSTAPGRSSSPADGWSALGAGWSPSTRTSQHQETSARSTGGTDQVRAEAEELRHPFDRPSGVEEHLPVDRIGPTGGRLSD